MVQLQVMVDIVDVSEKDMYIRADVEATCWTQYAVDEIHDIGE